MLMARKSSTVLSDVGLTYHFLADYPTLIKLFKALFISSPGLERLVLQLPDPYQRGGRRTSPYKPFQHLLDDEEFIFPHLRDFGYTTDGPSMAFSLRAFFLRHSEIQKLCFDNGTISSDLDPQALLKLRQFEGTWKSGIALSTIGSARPIEHLWLTIPRTIQARTQIASQLKDGLAKISPTIRELGLVESDPLIVNGFSPDDIRSISESCPNLTDFEFLLNRWGSVRGLRLGFPNKSSPTDRSIRFYCDTVID